jgi:peptidoglycan-associated lipoprotein
MHPSKTLALLVSSVAFLSACSSVKLDDKPVVEDRTTCNTPVVTMTPDSRSVGQVNTGSTDPLLDQNGVLAKRSVYFDYDSYSVRDDGKPVVNAHSQYLSKNQSRKVIIQGNTDERGGREYNLALGQKRAEAVRKSLVALGVSDNQLEAVSLGKEKPKATGSDEASWAENRRADIVY